MSSFVNSGTPQLFKYLYPDDGWRDLVSTNRPFLAMCPKTGGQSGVVTSGQPQGASTGIIHVWNYSNPQGASQSHASALLQQDSLTTGTQVLVQLSQFYQYLRFNAKELAASMSNMAAYMSTRKVNFDNAFSQMGLEIDLACHRAGSGIIGTISSGPTSNAITLSSNLSVQQFQVGMRIASYSTNPVDGTAPTSGGGSASVTKVSCTYNGTNFTVVLTLDNSNGFDSSTNKYIARLGNGLAFSATNAEGSLIGMGNWVPTSDPTSSDAFLSINRSVDISRLSGTRLSASGRTYREAVQEAAAVTASFGGKPDVVLMNPIDWDRANIELQGFARYEEFTVGNIAFGAMIIASPGGGKLRLMADPNQNVGEVRINTMDSWKLDHMRELVHIINDDGLELRKDPGADAFQLGIRSWCQLRCLDPRANAVITF